MSGRDAAHDDGMGRGAVYLADCKRDPVCSGRNARRSAASGTSSQFTAADTIRHSPCTGTNLQPASNNKMAEPSLNGHFFGNPKVLLCGSDCRYLLPRSTER